MKHLKTSQVVCSCPNCTETKGNFLPSGSPGYLFRRINPIPEISWIPTLDPAVAAMPGVTTEVLGLFWGYFCVCKVRVGEAAFSCQNKAFN